MVRWIRRSLGGRRWRWLLGWKVIGTGQYLHLEKRFRSTLQPTQSGQNILDLLWICSHADVVMRLLLEVGNRAVKRPGTEKLNHFR